MALSTELKARLAALNELTQRKPAGYEEDAIAVTQHIYAEGGKGLSLAVQARLQICLGRIATTRNPGMTAYNFQIARRIIARIPPEEIEPELLIDLALAESEMRANFGEYSAAKQTLASTITALGKLPGVVVRDVREPIDRALRQIAAKNSS